MVQIQFFFCQWCKWLSHIVCLPDKESLTFNSLLLFPPMYTTTSASNFLSCACIDETTKLLYSLSADWSSPNQTKTSSNIQKILLLLDLPMAYTYGSSVKIRHLVSLLMHVRASVKVSLLNGYFSYIFKYGIFPVVAESQVGPKCIIASAFTCDAVL